MILRVKIKINNKKKPKKRKKKRLCKFIILSSTDTHAQ